MYKKGERPLIAVFDSGIGGLNLLKACVQKIPQADFYYFADNYHVPYGNLCADKIKSYVFEIFDKIAMLNPAAAVVACNTATSCCINSLRSRYAFPIAGVQPAIKQAAALKGKFLVLATCATVKSLSFKNLLAKCGCLCDVAECRSLAEDIERNIFNLENFDVTPWLKNGNYTSVVLGCTHYVYVSDKLKAYYNCPIFDGIAGTADHLKEILGIFDHQQNGFQKICFVGGDFAKNEAVFKHIFL